MAETTECPSCHNKRTVICPCCSGKGWVEVSPFPPRLGKAYTCLDCAGLGEIPCPGCGRKKDRILFGNIQMNKTRPGFGRV
jgi:DnaJ-class molecular chaperone